MRENLRQHLALKAPKGCVGAEIGVATGQFTRKLLELDHLGWLHAVDKWDDHHCNGEYLKVLRQIGELDKLTIHKQEAKEWLKRQEDGSLGFIYIDCYAHTGQEDGKILEAAWPKLADGGLFAGDDYCERYPRTVSEVDRFANSIDRKVSVYDSHLNPLTASQRGLTSWDKSPSWYFRK